MVRSPCFTTRRINCPLQNGRSYQYTYILEYLPGFVKQKGAAIWAIYAWRVFLELKAVFEGSFKFKNVVEVVDCVGWLCFHPVVPDEEINHFAEVAGGFDVPGVEDEHSEQAPFFERELAESFAEGLARDVTRLAGGFADGVAEAFVNEPHGLWVVSVVLL